MEEQNKPEDEAELQSDTSEKKDDNLLLPDLNAQENVPQDVDDSQNPNQKAEEIVPEEVDESQDPNQKAEEIVPEDATPFPGARVESSQMRIPLHTENPPRFRINPSSFANEAQTEQRSWQQSPRQIRYLCPHHGYDCPLLQPGQNRSESIQLRMSQQSSQRSSTSYGGYQGQPSMSASSFFPSYSYGNTYNQQQQQQQQRSSRAPPPHAVLPQQQQQQRRHVSTYPTTVDQWVEQAIRYGLGVPPTEGFFRSRFYVTYEYEEPPRHPSQTSLLEVSQPPSPGPLPHERQHLLPGLPSTAQPLQANELPDNPQGTDLLPHEHQQQ